MDARLPSVAARFSYIFCPAEICWRGALALTAVAPAPAEMPGCRRGCRAGCGIQGGVVLGASDKIGAYPTDNPIDPVDIHATMYHCMGLDPAALIHDRLGQPHPLSIGQPVLALL